MTFANSGQLELLIAEYFEYITGEFHFEDVPSNDNTGELIEKRKVWDREPEPPTISGLAFYLGFDSREAFDEYKSKGTYSSLLKRAKLRIETEYEKKLHHTSPSGAIFALKNLGWNERDMNLNDDDMPHKLKIEIVDSGIPIATSEKDVNFF